MADNGNHSYPVGYKKPPRRTQFKPGQSGNAKGRPKGAQNFTSVMERELRTPIAITENGKRRRISKRQAIVKQTVNKAVGGDPKATSLLLTESRLRESQNSILVPQSLVIAPADEMVLNSLARRIWRLKSEPTLLNPSLLPESASEPQPTTPVDSNKGEF